MPGVLGIMAAGFGVQLHTMSLGVGTSGGNKGYVGGSFGTVDDATFTTGGGEGKTIVELYWVDATDTLVFSVSGNNAKNFDSTFARLTIGSMLFHRSAASYNGSSGANTAWSFSGVSSDPFASSPATVKLYGG